MARTRAAPVAVALSRTGPRGFRLPRQRDWMQLAAPSHENVGGVRIVDSVWSLSENWTGPASCVAMDETGRIEDCPAACVQDRRM